MISKEIIFKYKEILVKYRFKSQSTDRNHLFVIFSGFGAKGKETTYTFAGESALHVKGNILWIKDDFFGGATYYMCHNMDFSIEEAILSLIDKTLDDLALSRDACTMVGFSKGGSAALYYGLKYDFKNIISTVPQIKVGSYNKNLHASVMKRITRKGFEEEDRQTLDNLIPNLLKENTNSDKNIYLFTSPKDIQYKDEIEPYLNIFEKYKNFNYVYTISPFSDQHTAVTRYNLPLILSIMYALSENTPIYFGKIINGEDVTIENEEKIKFIENLKVKKEFVATLDSFEYKDGLFFPVGSCFLKGYSYTSYGLIKYNLVLKSEKEEFIFQIGTTRKSNSKEYFDRFYIPYTYTGFASLRHKGIDLSKLDFGKYELYLYAESFGVKSKISPSIDNLVFESFVVDNKEFNLYRNEDKLFFEINKYSKIENIFETMNKNLITSRYLKKFWIYKNKSIILELILNKNNVVFSSIPDFNENSLKVILWSRNNLKELSFLDGKFEKNENGNYVIFNDSLENINQAIHTINKYIYEVEKELIYNKPKTYDSILVKEKKGAISTILAFSSVGTKRGSFTFFKTFENIDANVVFINDYKSLWYTNGTPDFTCEYEFEKYIKDILDSLGTKELFTFGSSMGGYASFKYGSVFQADSIVAMCPEVELSMPFSKSILKVPALKGAGDLTRFKFKNPSKVYLFSGNDDFVDYYSSIKLKTVNPEFKLKILNNMPHIIAATIHEKVDLSVLAEKLFFQNDESVLEEIGHDRLVSYDIALDIKTFREKVRLEKTIDLSFKDSIVNTALEFPEWVLVQYYAYLVYKELKNLENQEKYLLKTLEAKKTHNTARLDLAKLYFNQEKIYKALDYLLVLKEHKFSFACGDLLYKVLVKLEKIDESRIVLEEMSKLELNDKQKKILVGYRK